jgi:uncharacterized protein
VILVDANLLLYAYDGSSPFHAKARSWLETTLNSDERVGLGLMPILAFVRIGTNPDVFDRPIRPADATAIVSTWLNRPNVGIATPGDRHWRILADVATRGQARGPRLMDAHLAALAIEHGATLATTDRGFGRFPGLRFVNPIA